MPKQNKLRGDWADILPQESTKTSPHGAVATTNPPLFGSEFGLAGSLRRHVSTTHPLLKKVDIRDFEPPSAKEGFLVSFATRKEWSDMKAEAKSPAPVRMCGQKQKENASKKRRKRISKMLWPSFIQEYHQETIPR